MRMFVTSISYLVVRDCRTIMHIRDIDISLLMTHDQHIEVTKLKKKKRDTKRTRNRQFEYSQHSQKGKSLIIPKSFVKPCTIFSQCPSTKVQSGAVRQGTDH